MFGRKRQIHWLDQPLFVLPSGDPYTRRDLMRSVAVYGVSGGGKTHGPGKFFARCIAADPRSTMFIICQKEGERAFFEEIYRKAGRTLHVIDASGKGRCNIIEAMVKRGADARKITNRLMTLNSAVQIGSAKGGGGDNPFWPELHERITLNAVGAVMMGSKTIDAPTLRDFIGTAASSPDQLRDEKWQSMPHNQIMQAAHKAKKGEIEAADFDNYRMFWYNEWPRMDPRVRANGTSMTQNTLGVFCSGLVRMLLSTKTTVDCSVIEKGESILIDLPFERHGPEARMVAQAMLSDWQDHILTRKVADNSFYSVGFFDEVQELPADPMAPFLAKCRSNLGCMFTLTQTVHSPLGTSGNTHSAHHRIQALQSNFGYRIYCSSDPDTAADAVKLGGEDLEDMTSITPEHQNGALDDSSPLCRVSLSQSYQPRIKAIDLMSLPTGKAPHYRIGACLIRLDEPFRNGRTFQYVYFDPR